MAIVGYLEDGDNILIPAMKGWADPEPAWWLNLQASPEATVKLPAGVSRMMIARAATEVERPRLWAKFIDLDSAAFGDASAALRSRETVIVVLQPES